MNEGSIHTGVVKNAGDKGCDIFFETFGVEGFCPSRHMTKEDGSRLVNDETAEFKVIEFSKDARRIVVSHSQLNKDVAKKERATDNANKATAAKKTASAVKKVQSSQEKTTLGDLGGLAALKKEMEKGEK